MDLRIGVIHTPRELTVELDDDTDRAALEAQVSEVLADEDTVLWLTDRRGRRVAVPSKRIAYLELGAPDADRRIGFGG